MADGSAIEWTDATWNPVTGCTKITAGCANCYAARFSERFRGVPVQSYANGFDLTFRPERIAQPLSWGAPNDFVNSMSDLFHKGVPESFIDQHLHHGGSQLARLPDVDQAQFIDAILPASTISYRYVTSTYLVRGVCRKCAC
jgi:Protein of unknown function (DUF5131)